MVKHKRFKLCVRTVLWIVIVVSVILLAWWVLSLIIYVNEDDSPRSSSSASVPVSRPLDLSGYLTQSDLLDNADLTGLIQKNAAQAAQTMVTRMMNGGAKTQSSPAVTTQPSVAPLTAITTAPASTVTVTTPVATPSVTPYAFGRGLSVNNNVISADLGDSIGTDEIDDGAVTLGKLAQGTCTQNQVVGLGTGGWACQTLPSTPVYTAGRAITLASDVISLDPSAPETWTGLQTFGAGFVLGGVTYSALDGTGLTVTNGVLGTVIGDSVDTPDLSTGAVTAAKLATNSVTNSAVADGTLSPGKLAAGTCPDAAVLTLTGGSWSCRAVPAVTSYTGGSGITITGHTVTLDPSSANAWTGLQTLGGGLSLGGVSYSGLNGAGLVVNNGVLGTALGTSIETPELTDAAVTSAKLAAGSVTNNAVSDGGLALSKLAPGSCANGQLLGRAAGAWVCQTIPSATPYMGGSGITVSANTIALDPASANTWSAPQTFAGGAVIGNKTYAALDGTGLVVTNGTLATTLGTMIDTTEISDGAVTAGKIADGALPVSKLSGGACVSGQLYKWNGSAWVCASDNVNTYLAGNGLTLASNTLALDLGAANTWTGLQTFSAGLALSGTTYTNLAGSGLAVSNGALTSVLGTSIDSSKIVSGGITSGSLAAGSVTSLAILDGTVGTNDLTDGAVTALKLADGTITGAKLASGTITTNLLADAAVTTDKLSASAKKHVVTGAIGSISVSNLTAFEQPVFIAPSNGTITKVTFVAGAGVSASANQGSLTILRKSSPAATAATLNLGSTGLAAYVGTSATLGSGLTFTAGDTYSFRYNPGTLGVGVQGLLVSIEYTASE